jgi:hypothetical protein
LIKEIRENVAVVISSTSQGKPAERDDPRENVLGYDVVKAAPAYSAVAGLISGFALAAVVLVLTVAASARLTHAQEISLGFATSLFALGFIGCLLCSFSFASLGGEGNSPATMTDSMLVGSGLLISLLAVLGGFQALAQAFLPESEVVFIAVLALTATLGPLFVWFPHWDIVQRFGPSHHEGPPRSTAEARRLILHACLLGLVAAGAGVALHYSKVLGDPTRWEYLVLTFTGLAYTGSMAALGLLVSTVKGRARLTFKETWALALFQSATILVMLALLP